MNSPYGQCSLFLYPQQVKTKPPEPALLPELALLIESLKEIDFIAGPIDKPQANSFYSGEKFLDYIAYLGCAPAIQFAASDNNDNYCYIKIHNYDTKKLIASQKLSRAPHCPHCNKAVNHWADNKTASTIRCDSCHTSSNIEAFNWRKMAGYAHLFIEITDIFPKEAIPQQCLLDKLAIITDTEWTYFYSCQ